MSNLEQDLPVYWPYSTPDVPHRLTRPSQGLQTDASWLAQGIGMIFPPSSKHLAMYGEEENNAWAYAYISHLKVHNLDLDRKINALFKCLNDNHKAIV